MAVSIGGKVQSLLARGGRVHPNPFRAACFAGGLGIQEWFCSSHALAQVGDADAVAAIGRALVAAQVAEGGDAGSWAPIGVFGAAGGRVWTTAMAVPVLEAPYRYTREVWRLVRPGAGRDGDRGR